MADSVLEMPPWELFPAVHRAQMRLQLYVAGRVHGLLLDVLDEGRAALSDAANQDGTLDGLGLNLVMSWMEGAWRTFMQGYRAIFETARRETVLLAFGVLPALHAAYFGDVLEESRLQEQEIWSGGVSFFEPQLEELIAAANERLYGDGLKLSDRIWRLDQEGLEGIRSTVMAGVADSKSAFQIAQDLEEYLGPGQECPRWTRYRLYGLTKTDIAQGRKGGLYSGDECAEQGVSYKALRLARTEIQYIHHAAAQRVRERLPFVTAEQVVLSPAHPRRDICDEVIEAAPNGDGVYAIGEIVMPIHPNCICDQRSVLMDDDAFTTKLRGWVTGDQPWPEMDTYANWVGMGRRNMTSPFLRGLEVGLQLWLFGGEDDHDARIAGAA
jgi:hypothetical protein